MPFKYGLFKGKNYQDLTVKEVMVKLDELTTKVEELYRLRRLTTSYEEYNKIKNEIQEINQQIMYINGTVLKLRTNKVDINKYRRGIV